MHLTKGQSRALAGAILGFFVLIFLFFTPRQEGLKPIATLPASTPAPDSGNAGAPSIVLRDFQRSESRDGKKLWEVKAEGGLYYPASSSAELTKAHLWFYRERDNTVLLDADQAVLFLEGAALKKAELRGNIKVEYNSKAELHTASASYDKELDQVTAPGQVQITSELLDITGESLTADLKTQQIILRKNVRSVIRAKKEDAHE
ncbi:MAG: LPS export ABC transporter periplasmic protein LptC [Oligoflexia bacterium]|nr:LPS export ABC transporter periplasmic protein LptC [Oligoflexia bacterium]